MKKFLKVNIEASKEIILILSEKEQLKDIMKEMIIAGDLKKPGMGVIFTLAIDNLIGLKHRIDFEDIE